MTAYTLQIQLLSGTTFGRGSGQVAAVDLEVQHDELGCPYWSGRAIKGVLVNECADILGALGGVNAPDPWRRAAAALFGSPGSAPDDQSSLSIGEAHLPNDLHTFLQWQLDQRIAARQQVKASPSEKRSAAAKQQVQFRKELLNCLTTMRSQTALESDGTAKEHSLRTQRVLLPELTFVADLTITLDLKDYEKGLLAACVMAMRASGSGRNRGKGAIQASLFAGNKDVTADWFKLFKNEVQAWLH